MSRLRPSRRSPPAPSSRGCRAVPVTGVPSRPGACRTCCPEGGPSPRPAACVDLAAAWGVDSPSGRRRPRCRRHPRRTGPHGELGAWSSAGSTPTTGRPGGSAPRSRRQFVVSLEVREGGVTRAADVVFPVAPVIDKAGTFVDLGGSSARVRGGPRQPGLAARRAGPRRHRRGARPHRSGFRTVAEARARDGGVGPWDGDRAGEIDAGSARRRRPRPAGRARTWKQLSTTARCRTATTYSRHRPPAVARVTRRPRRGRAEGDPHGDRGSVTLPVEVADLPTASSGCRRTPRQRRARRPRLARQPGTVKGGAQ